MAILSTGCNFVFLFLLVSLCFGRLSLLFFLLLSCAAVSVLFFLFVFSAVAPGLCASCGVFVALLFSSWPSGSMIKVGCSKKIEKKSEITL